MADKPPDNVVPFDGCSDGVSSQPPHPFQLIPVGKFAILEYNNWIIDDVLPRAELAIIFGESGAGKSFLALDLAMAIARGQPWNEHDVAVGRVIYIIAEAARSFKRRLLAYGLRHNVNLNELTNFEVVANNPDFLHFPHAATIAANIGAADIIFIDTLARIMPGGNENSGEHVGKVIGECQALQRATGALVVLIHHAGKDHALGARGWSGLKAASDTEIEVTKGVNVKKAKITKQKDGEEGLEFGFTLDPVTLGQDTRGKDVISCTVSFCQAESTTKPKPIKLGFVEQTVLETFLAYGVAQVAIEDLIRRAKVEIPHDPETEDRRRDRVVRAIEGLKKKGILGLVNDLVFQAGQL